MHAKCTTLAMARFLLLTSAVCWLGIMISLSVQTSYPPFVADDSPDREDERGYGEMAEARERYLQERADEVVTIWDAPTNAFFPFVGDVHEVKGCTKARLCRFVRGAGAAHQGADARFFHIPNLQQSGTYTLPPKARAEQLDFGFASETPLYYPWLHSATFMGQFDRTFGYPSSRPPWHTNVPLGPYSWNGAHKGGLRVPGYAAELDFERELAVPIPHQQQNRTARAFWMAANCGAKNMRHSLAQALSWGNWGHVDASDMVDSFGACMRTREMPQQQQPPSAETHADKDSVKLRVMRSYVLDLAFENSHCEEYVTEKVWHGLAVGTIPVFFGTKTVESLLPSRDAAILASDFASADELIEYLRKVLASPALQAKHLAWRSSNATVNTTFGALLEYSRRINQETNLDCLLCTAARDMKMQRQLLSPPHSKAMMPPQAKARPYPPCGENEAAMRFARGR